MRTRARADLAIQVLFLVGIATAIAGIVVARDSTAVGVVLAVGGFVVASLGPVLISVPSESRSGRHDEKRIG